MLGHCFVIFKPSPKRLNCILWFNYEFDCIDKTKFLDIFFKTGFTLFTNVYFKSKLEYYLDIKKTYKHIIKNKCHG